MCVCMCMCVRACVCVVVWGWRGGGGNPVINNTDYSEANSYVTVPPKTRDSIA